MVGTYSDIVRSFDLEPEFRGPWAVVGRAERAQGWKLHVSSVPVQAAKLLGVLVPRFRDRRVSFKIARDEATLFLLNEGALGPTQIGKFVTIYPDTDTAGRELAEELIAATASFEGPVVMTDLRLGSVIYARYGGFNPETRRDRLGQIYSVLQQSDGSRRSDDYSVPFVSPDGVPNPFGDLVAHHEPDLLASSPGKLFGPGYLLLRILKSNPKGSVFLALDLQSQAHVGLTVIKEGRRHCMSDRFGRDVRSRLRHQASVHHALAGRVPLPRAGSYFELSGNSYLALEHVDGRDLGSELSQPYGSRVPAEQRRLVAHFVDLVAAVAAVHAVGYVHRDLAPTNIRVRPDGSICLLDFELAYQLGSDEPPFSQGTPGFMSPQQQTDEAPALADDVYAVGALAVLMLTALDPRRVLFASEHRRANQLHELTGGPRALAEIIAQCLATCPASRPSLATVGQALVDVRDSIAEHTSVVAAHFIAGRRSTGVIERQARDHLAGGARGLLHDTLLDEESGLWLSPVVRSGVHKPETGWGYTLYRSASRGVAGVVYALARLARSGVVADGTRAHVERAVDWLLAHAPTADDQLPGLHFGEAGVALAVVEAVGAGLLDRGPWLSEYLAEALSGPLDWPDITHGAAGQGIAALACADLLGETDLAALAHRCADYLITTQDADGGWALPDGVEAMTGARYTGFAHGAAGQVYFLAEYAARFRHSGAERAARSGAEWLIARAVISNGPEPTAAWPMKEGDNERWMWWCHGAPGIALAFLKLFECTRATQYAELATQALRTHPRDVRYSNLSQCHGLSGLGEIYIEAARVLQDDRWLARAAHIGRLLLQIARESEQRALTWLVEDPYKATGDLMIGSGGVVHLLLRLSGKAPALGPPLLLENRQQILNT